jgi:hypothetical protein
MEQIEDLLVRKINILHRFDRAFDHDVVAFFH